MRERNVLPVRVHWVWRIERGELQNERAGDGTRLITASRSGGMRSGTEGEGAWNDCQHYRIPHYHYGRALLAAD